MTVLLLHVRKNTLPAGLLDSPELADLTVITEPGHLQRYPARVEVRLLDDVLDADAVRRTALEIDRENRIISVFSPFELGQSVAAYVRGHLGLPGVSFDTALACSHKYVMKQRMAAYGLPVPDLRQVPGPAQVLAAAEELGWRVVVKPTLGGGSMNVVRLDGRSACEAFPGSAIALSLELTGAPVVVERLVDLRAELHCDGIVHDGKVKFVGVSRYLAPLLECPDGRNGSYVLSQNDPVSVAAEHLHARAVAAVGLDAGVTHLELFETEDGLQTGEIACRPSGGGVPAALQHAAGVDLWRAFVATSFGQTPDVTTRPTEGVWVNLHLPVRSGTITDLSSADELRAAPWVEDVQMTMAVGDVVPDAYNSSFATGVVFLRVPDVASVDRAVDETMRVYRFSTDEVERVRADV